MSEDPDFLSILNIRLSQLKNMFDNSYLLKKSKYTQIPMLSSGNELDLNNKLCLL